MASGLFYFQGAYINVAALSHATDGENRKSTNWI